jgi:hypothetical protein
MLSSYTKDRSVMTTTYRCFKATLTSAVEFNSSGKYIQVCEQEVTDFPRTVAPARVISNFAHQATQTMPQPQQSSFKPKPVADKQAQHTNEAPLSPPSKTAVAQNHAMLEETTG